MIEVSISHLASDAGVSGAYSTTGQPATIPAPIIGGYIWENLRPEWVSMIPVLIDLPMRLPILSTVTETLNRDQNAQEQD